jgi:hypothetical protein
MLRKISCSLVAVCSFFSSIAQKADSTAPKTPPPVTITGSVDGYYRYNFSNPKTSPYNNLTSFTNSQSSFELGMASIRADHSFGKVSATADLGFGRRAQEYSYNDGSSLVAVKQLYVTYQATDHLKFTMGKWGTHIGYEVLDAFSNRNYSMDYMFSYGPFFHTGLKADITLGGKSALMVGIANPTDFSTTTSSTKTFIGQFSTSTKDDKWKFFLNYQGYGGVSETHLIAPGYNLYKSMSQFDLVINGTLNSQWGIGYNGTVQSVNNDGASQSWWGSALYFNYDPNSNVGFTLRGEYFADHKYALKVGSDVFDLTLSSQIHAGTNLTIIPEIRLDNAKDNIFQDSDGNGTKSTFTGLLAVVYHF